MKKDIAFYIVFTLVIASIVGFSFYVKYENEKPKNEVDIPQEQENKELIINSEKTVKDMLEFLDENSIDESELNDDVLRSDIIDKLNILLGLTCTKSEFSIDQYFVSINEANGCNYSFLSNMFKTGDLSQKEKLEIVLSSVNFKKISIDQIDNVINNVKDEKLKKRLARIYATTRRFYGDDRQYLSIVDVDDVKQKYKEMFNENLTRFEDGWYGPLGTIYECDYEENDNVYYRIVGVGGGSGFIRNYLFYINNITQYNDKVYVYMNFGIVGVNGHTTPRDDFSYKIVDTFEDRDNYEINETNYNEFKNYRFTFTKNDNGTYSFESLKEVRFK